MWSETHWMRIKRSAPCAWQWKPVVSPQWNAKKVAADTKWWSDAAPMLRRSPISKPNRLAEEWKTTSRRRTWLCCQWRERCLARVELNTSSRAGWFVETDSTHPEFAMCDGHGSWLHVMKEGDNTHGSTQKMDSQEGVVVEARSRGWWWTLRRWWSETTSPVWWYAE